MKSIIYTHTKLFIDALDRYIHKGIDCGKIKIIGIARDTKKESIMLFLYIRGVHINDVERLKDRLSKIGKIYQFHYPPYSNKSVDVDLIFDNKYIVVSENMSDYEILSELSKYNGEFSNMLAEVLVENLIEGDKI